MPRKYYNNKKCEIYGKLNKTRKITTNMFILQSNL